MAIKGKDELYSGIANNGSFAADDANNLPENTSVLGFLKNLKVSSIVDNTLNRSIWLRTMFFQRDKAFVHKIEDKATATQVGGTIDPDPTINSYVSYEQLPSIVTSNVNDFTVATVPSDGIFIANQPFGQIIPITSGKNKVYQFLADPSFIKLIKQRTTPSSSLPLFYCHAKNVSGTGVNLGDGSINNPFGTLDSLLVKIDSDITIKNYTIILLGGTFNVAQNIYRGCSFYGFPGVVINYTGTDYLLSQRIVGSTNEDTNANRKYDGNFYFTGDIAVNITSSTGGFQDLGFYSSNLAGNSGKSWFVNISNLNVTTSHNQSGSGSTLRNFPIILLYGYINSYDITINFVNLTAVSNISFTEARKSNINPITGADYANSGANLILKIQNLNTYDNFALLTTGLSNFDFYARFIDIVINTIAIVSPAIDYRLFKGRLNQSRKHTFNFNIKKISLNNVPTTSSIINLIENFGGNYIDGTNIAYFIFNNTLFTYNSAYNSSFAAATPNQLFIAFSDTTIINVLFKQCLKSNAISIFSTQASSVEKGFGLDGLLLSTSATVAISSLYGTTLND